MFRGRCCFRSLVARILFGLEAGFFLLDFASFGVLSLAAGIVLCLAARFLGGRQD
jgi:hypothetical protein